MIYSIQGALTAQKHNFIVVDAGGVGYKIFTNQATLAHLPAVAQALAGLPTVQENVLLYCHLHAPEGALELYGFLKPEELELFELLISISGVGPKSALSVLDVSDLKNIEAAISEGRPDLLSRASGIGRKTAERIILELKSKVHTSESVAAVKKMDTDADLVEALVGLGYRREQAQAALAKIPAEESSLEKRLKAALAILHSK